MSTNNSSEELRAELKSLADSLEAILNDTGSKSKEEIENIKSKAESALFSSRQKLSMAGEKITAQTKEMAGKADHYVRENPWAGIGIGATVGVVLGILLAKR
nr:YqjD family protein [uncultured Moellerella sp.]